MNQTGAVMPPSPDPGTLGVMETLGDLTLAAGHDPRLGRVRLAPPVAAALRAALDWLHGDGTRRPLMVRVDDTALEVWLERVDARGLVAAGEVLGSVAGSLGRGGYGARRTAMWTVRVPIAAARESFLMIVRGNLRLALPWPSVLHVAMAKRHDLDNAHLSAPLVEAPGTLTTAEEIPVVLLGHGLKRAWLAADRLVWRLGATRAQAAPAPAEGLTHSVETEEDQPYWVIDPAWLLRDVQLPALPKAEQPVVLTAADVIPIELPPTLDRIHVTRIEEGPFGEEPAFGEEPESSAEHAGPHEVPAREPSSSEAPAVERFEEGSTQEAAEGARVTPSSGRAQEPGMADWRAPAGPARMAGPRTRGDARPPSAAYEHESPIEPPDPVVEARQQTSSRRAALVAEDSLVAAAFLTRLLEQEGLLVKSVSKAAPLFSEAARGGWAVALVDVELPDGRGAAFLRELRDAFEHPTRSDQGVPTLIALVRDADDIAEARRAGISLVLRKPFDAQALRALLRRAGITMEETR